MRSGMWLLVTCGMACTAAAGVGISEDRAQERQQSPPDTSTQPGRAVEHFEYFSRRGKSGTQAAVTNPPAQGERRRTTAAPSEGSGQQSTSGKRLPLRYSRRLDTPRPYPGGGTAVPRVKNYYRELFGSDRRSKQPTSTRKTEASAKDAIHALYERREGTPKHHRIQQVRATEQNVSPFRTVGHPAAPTAEKPGFSEKPGFVSAAIDQPEKRKSVSIPAGGESPARPGIGLAGPTSGGPHAPMVTVRWIKRGDVNISQECHCDLLVRNSGGVPANDVRVEAYFPTSVRLTGADPVPVEKRDHLAWTFESLAPGAEQTIHIRMIPSQRGKLATRALVRFTWAASGLFDVREPLLKVTIDGPNEVMIGEPASHIVTVSNPGTGVAHDVSIEASIPKGLEHPRGKRLVMDIGSLSPGESRKMRLALVAVDGGQHRLFVQARAAGNLKQAVESQISVVAPSLKVTVDGPKLRYLGRQAQYRLTVTNNGSAATNNVRAMHRIPDGFKFVSADNGGEFDASSNTMNWFIGRLEAGQSAQVQVQLAATKLGSFVHRAGAISEHGARTETRITTRVQGTASLVLEILDLDDPVEIGTETAYEIRVRNEGTKAAQNVLVSCELAKGVELIAAEGPAKHVAENGLVVFKSLPALRPGKTAIYRVHVRGSIAGNHRFRTRLASDSIQEPLIFEELTKFYQD